MNSKDNSEKKKKTNEELRKEGHRAAELIRECLVLNNVDPSLALDTLQFLYASIVCDNYSYKDYCKHMDYVKKSYKSMWDEYGSEI